MDSWSAPRPIRPAATVLQAYLLGVVDFDAMLALQRRLVYEVSGDRNCNVLVLCEHPPLVSIGREGSRSHVLCEPEELAAARWPVRWVNRGGGCLLHLPGQLAVYPIFALDRLGLSVRAYLDRLHAAVTSVAAGFQTPATTRPDRPGVWVGDRLLAHVGVAVRGWVSYFGAALNVDPDLEPFRMVACGGPGAGPMTSLQRERRQTTRMATVRQRMLDAIAAAFGFASVSLFHQHPAIPMKAPADAIATRSL